MPKIRDYTWNYGTTTTATTITAYLPDYDPNDLLIAIVSTDTGTQTVTSTGWTKLVGVTSTVHVSIMWKIAGASEADPVFTYTTAETANVYLISVMDVNTTTPFNGTGGAGTGYFTSGVTAATGNMPSLTTTVANSLILYFAAESGAAVPSVLKGACTLEAASDGSAHSDGFGWSFKPTAGAVTSAQYIKSGTAAGVIGTIGISPPASGATVIPTYCASDASIYIDPIHGAVAFNGNTAFAATATNNFGTTLGGRTISNGTAASATDVGLNSFHSMGQITGVATVNTAAGAALVLATANKPNVTGKNVIAHCKPSTPKVLQNTDPVTKQGTATKGIYFGMASTAATAHKIWHVHGANTSWDSASHIPMVINSLNTSGVYQTTGTLNAASVLAFGFFISGFLTAPVWQFGSLWALDTTAVAGGNATFPIDTEGVWKVCAAGKERMSVLKQGASQLMVLQPIQFGDGGTSPTYLNLDSSAIEFPKQYDQASKNTFYCSADNVAGLTYYAGASDTIKHTNAVVSSLSKFHWRIHASSSVSASYDFTGLSIIGAGDVQLRPVTTFSEVSFTTCALITQNNAALSSSNFKNSYLLSTNLSNISNCSFLSTATGHAIEITAIGTYSFSGNIFSGYGIAGSTNAAIYNNSGGLVTINISNGGSTPTIRNGAGASTVVNNTISLTLTGIQTGSDVVILQAGTTSQITEEQNISGTSYVFVYSTQQNIDIGVFKTGYVPFYIRNYSLGATNSNLPVAQVPDRNFL